MELFCIKKTERLCLGGPLGFTNYVNFKWKLSKTTSKTPKITK